MSTTVSRRFYVYAHYRQSDGVVFYVGKGTRRRAWAHGGRSAFWHNVASQHGVVVKVWASGLTSEQAIRAEAEWIALYGRRADGSGCLVNISEGGDGAPRGNKHRLGKTHGEATRQKISSAKTGCVSYWRGRRMPRHVILAAAAGAAKKRGALNHKSIRVRCIESGEVFASARQAAQSIGVVSTALYNHLAGRSQCVGGYTFEKLEHTGGAA